MRSSPFGEWVNVFYDPSKTNTATLLQLIKDRNCASAQHIADRKGHALNPIIAPGDPVQFQVKSAAALELNAASQLPDGWKLAGQSSGGEGLQIVTFSTPNNTQQGNVDLDLQFSNGTSVATRIAVVRQVGRH